MKNGRLSTEKVVVVEANKRNLERVVKNCNSKIKNYEIEVTETIKHLKKEKQDMTVKAKMGADRFKAC